MSTSASPPDSLPRGEKRKATGATESKRARYDPTVDVHKERIIRQYIVENWSTKQICEDLKLNHGLNQTPKQITGRLGSWGIRKNIKRDEWIGVESLLKEREATGKSESEVILGDAIFVSEKRRKKAKSRNYETYLERLLREQKSGRHQSKVPSFTKLTCKFAGAFADFFFSRIEGDKTSLISPEAERSNAKSLLQVTTPPDYREFESLVISGIVPPGFIYRLPTAITADLLSRIVKSVMAPREKAEWAVGATLPRENNLLHLLFFKLSNNFWGGSDIDFLLDQLDEMNYGEALEQFLAVKSPATAIACEPLLQYAFLRGDQSLGRTIMRLYPETRLDFADLLISMVREYTSYTGASLKWSKEERRKRLEQIRSIMMVLKERKLSPNDGEQARWLLYVCQHLLSDIDLFFGAWDSTRVPADMIEKSTLSRNVDLDHEPLASLKEEELQKLLQAGFRENLELFMLRAIINDDIGIAFAFMRYWSPALLSDIPEGYIDIAGGMQVHPWELIGILQFSKVLTIALSQFDASEVKGKGDPNYFPEFGPFETSTQREIAFLLYIASLNPDIFGFALNAIELKSPGTCALRPLECVDNFGFDQSLRDPIFPMFPYKFYGEPSTKNSLQVLRHFFNEGADPGATQLWQGKIWDQFLSDEFYDQIVESDTAIGGSRFRASPLFMSVIEAFMEAGCRAEYAVIPSSIGYPVLPIEIAFTLSNPDLFLYLLNKGATLECFKAEDYEVPYPRGAYINPDIQTILRLSDDIDPAQIRLYWGHRIVFPRKPFRASKIFTRNIEVGRFELAKRSFYEDLTKEEKSEAFEVLIAALLQIEPADDHVNYALGVGMIRDSFEVLRQTVTEQTQTSAWEKYKTAILRLIRGKGDKLLAELLLDSEIVARRSDGTQQRWVNHAACHSVACLKILLYWAGDRSFDLVKGEDPDDTPLHAAVRLLNLRAIEFLLEQGADIYSLGTHPDSMTPLQVAVDRRRIDAIALFLQVYPECREYILLEAGRKKDTILVRYIVDWQPRESGVEPSLADPIYDAF